MRKIDQFLQAALQQSASDLHFLSGDPPRIRVHGGLQNMMDTQLSVDIVQEAIFEIMDGAAQRTFEQQDAADFEYEIPDLSRFRRCRWMNSTCRASCTTFASTPRG